MNAPEPAVTLAAQMLPLSLITPSKTNPRKTFDAGALAELTESVRQHGILQPVLVRPLDGKTPSYELVAGERRLRAAKAAQLDHIPALVRSMTELQALELQVIENLQREDLHPLEEAEGYERLIKQHKITVDELVAKVGKSRAYIYARLKLTALSVETRKLFYDGRLNPSTALLVARIPVPKLQLDAAKEIAGGVHGQGEMSYRMAAEHVHRNFMLRLKDAPFSISDLELVAKAGACGNCPKRTGNQPELFGDIADADVCTDPTCFAEKKAAHFVQLRASAESRGQEVITGKKAKELAPWGEHSLRGVERLTGEVRVGDKYQKVSALVKKVGLDTKLLELPNSGELIEVVPSGALQAALKKHGLVKAPEFDRGVAKETREATKRLRAKHELEQTVRERVFSSLVGRLTMTGKATPEDGAMVAKYMWLQADYDAQVRVAKLWGWIDPPKPGKEGKPRRDDFSANVQAIDKAAKRVAELTPAELWRLMIVLALVDDVDDTKPEQLLAAAARHEVDVDEIRKEVVAELKEKAAAKKPAKKQSRGSKRAAAAAAAT